MRITIQVTCDSPEDAMNAMARLTAPNVTMSIERMPFKGSTPDELDSYLSTGKKVSGSETGAKDSSKKVDNDSETSGLDSHPTTRPNVNPGEPAIGKIGIATTELILNDLNAGKQLPSPKYDEHMKLLWKRGSVKYDNVTKEYYL